MSKEEAVKLINRIVNNQKLLNKLERMRDDQKLAEAIRKKAKQWNYNITAQDYYEAMMEKFGDDLSRSEVRNIEP